MVKLIKARQVDMVSIYRAAGLSAGSDLFILQDEVTDYVCTIGIMINATASTYRAARHATIVRACRRMALSSFCFETDMNAGSKVDGRWVFDMATL